MQNHNDTIKTNDTVLRKIYLSLYWKGCVWEGVRDWTELQHIDPHSIGHSFFPVLLGCSTRGLGAQPLWDKFLNPASLQLIWSPSAGFLSSPGLYNNLTSTLLPPSVTISHSFNPSTVKVMISWYSSTGCTCYLHRYISYFDCLPRSGVNIQQLDWLLNNFKGWYAIKFNHQASKQPTNQWNFSCKCTSLTFKSIYFL